MSEPITAPAESRPAGLTSLLAKFFSDKNLSSTKADAVLNPELYEDVWRAFDGRVDVVNRGQAMSGCYEHDCARGRDKLRVIERGETYVVDCPFCHDTRRRLWINHRYGVEDFNISYEFQDDSGSTTTMYHKGFELWKCYNEECQSAKENRKKLREMLKPLFGHTYMAGPLHGKKELRSFKVAPPPVTTKPRPRLSPCEFPGIAVPINSLEKSHPAVQYLANRRFDVDELYEVWGVLLATEIPARTRESIVLNRIIIPVRLDGAMVGWQARFVGDVDWKVTGIQKYLTFFPKSLTLYGIDEMRDAEMGVLIEGATDVWRYGPGACACMGKKLSPIQAQMLTLVLGKRPLVMVPDTNDPQSWDMFVDSAAALRHYGYDGKISVAPLPPGQDPGMQERDALRGLVKYCSEFPV